jgi:LPS export ABC transporter protein LptC
LIYRLLILLALVLVGVAVWLTLTSEQTGRVAIQTSRRPGTDQGYAATDATVVQTGADGLPMYTLQAQHVQQDPQSDIIDLSAVHMTYRDTAGGQWQGHADQARARQDSAQIDLTGAVNLSGTFAGNDQPAHILTDELHVDTRAEVIQTGSAVKLLWAGVVVDARGLVVHIKNHNIRLDSDVRGQYVP